jgi:hypothetical protein
MTRHFLAAALVAAAPALAAAQAGLLTDRTDLAPITLSAGQPMAAEPYALTAGKYYRVTIVADGSAELAIAGPDFFRNMWVNEVVINDIEVRPLGIDSIEFDDEGEATISFVPIRPGAFTLGVRGLEGDGSEAVFVVGP